MTRRQYKTGMGCETANRRMRQIGRMRHMAHRRNDPEQRETGKAELADEGPRPERPCPNR